MIACSGSAFPAATRDPGSGPSSTEDGGRSPGGRPQAPGDAVLEVRDVFEDDFHQIHEELLVRLDPRVTRSRWERLFHHPWRDSSRPVGVALQDGGRPVGFLSLLFAPLPPGDPGSTICNLSSWIVLDAYRGSSLRLLGPVLANREWTVTNLTPTEEVGRLFQRLGFRTLETHRCLLPLRPDRLVRPGRGVEVRAVDPSDPGELEGAHRWLVEQHGELAHYMALEGPGSRGLVVYGLGRVKGLPAIRLHHVSDPALFREGLAAVQRFLLRKHGACMLVFDRRILGNHTPQGTIHRPLPVVRLFRSNDRTETELTELFSEMILLDL
ncbi:MAG: hypothetical protein EA421_11475 [Gemmatimonadales bacterium]|nr:MAG: hypothetical protein EA421_11475 [Gemmatimonadales bacterium]